MAAECAVSFGIAALRARQDETANAAELRRGRYWVKTDRSAVIRALDLIEAVSGDPFQGPVSLNRSATSSRAVGRGASRRNIGWYTTSPVFDPIGIHLERIPRRMPARQCSEKIPHRKNNIAAISTHRARAEGKSTPRRGKRCGPPSEALPAKASGLSREETA